MFSVIIPVYQAVDTLKKCVQSILVQDVDGMEIILVDDGSTDGSGGLCDELSQKYENIVVKHIKNSGTYQARRQGVEIAQGDVITFVDADDWIDSGAYMHLLKKFKEYEVDMLLFEYHICGKDKDNIFYPCREGVYNKKDIENELLDSMMWDLKLGRNKISPSLCCKLIKKDLFLQVTNGVTERIVWGDDAAVTYPMLCAADSIYIYNKTFYNYNITASSCTQNYSVDRIKELQNFRTTLEEKIAISTNKNFRWQVDCYMRIFLDMLAMGWFGRNIK